MIQKHMSRVSSSLKNREKVKIKPYGIELPTGKHYVHIIDNTSFLPFSRETVLNVLLGIGTYSVCTLMYITLTAQ